MGGQHGALLHVGHIAALALMETDQHLALLDHMAHRQTGAVAITPGRAFDGPQHGLGLDLAQVPEVVFEHALLDGNLGAHVQVLHLAATAGTGVQAKVLAAGAHTLRRFAVNRHQAGLLPVVLFAVGVGGDQLERQGTVDEDHLAVGLAGNALGIQVHGLHLQPAFGQVALGILRGGFKRGG
ncbi:hypothetical protein D3C71_1231260 [compost metagenome]